MLTQAPLPTWLNLIRGLIRRPPSDAVLASPWCREGDVAGWLSRSAWSIALIALWRSRQTSALPITVWIPDYFCNSSLAPLRAIGAKLVFYPLTDTLAPDMGACKAQSDAAPPDLFLFVHYFGQALSAASARDFCALKGAWLIEDAAHVLRPTAGIGTCGDFVLYSPHKHLPIPTGAVLVVRANGPSRFQAEEVASFGAPRAWPKQLCDLEQVVTPSTKRLRWHSAFWLAKRMLQRLKLGRAHRSVPPYSESSTVDQGASDPLEAPPLTGIARRLLAGLHADLGTVARRRQRHELLWDELLIGNTYASGGVPFVAATARSIDRNWTPYLAGYRADLADAEATYLLWRKKGLPVTTWPDLPPEVKADRNNHARAWQLRHTRLYLPVHQSLDARLILRQLKLPKTILDGALRLKLVWDRATSQQWSDWEAQADRSNLMQNWGYGEAKSESSGWRVRRGVFYRANEPIALLQVLEKRIAGFLRITRINRGPLSIRALDAREHQAVWTELSRLGKILSGRLLSVAPELDLSGLSLALLAGLEFRQFSPNAWESACVDLGLDLNMLRKRLDGKWRNMLVSSERAGLRLEVERDNVALEWMLSRYQELKLAKGFTGLPIAMYVALRNHLDHGSKLFILRSIHEGEPIAGICLISHGATATYLLGWNGDRGRALKANQYLLWCAISLLKELGLRWFDLGGISEEHTPGISAFKLGLNGSRYELVGEYWKW
jgi:hypothetical protein